jgi:SAM-dependent methyltransferase
MDRLGPVMLRRRRPADPYRGSVTIRVDPTVLAELESGGVGHRGGSIWRDPHVQEQLLAAHLDEATTAATRSPEAVRRTLELATRGVPPGGSVLDLGCGPGLYAQRLADRGFDVTGVDLNAASVRHARGQAAGSIRYLEADYTATMPEGPFDLVLLVYLDFGTHLPEVQRARLGAVRSRLRPGGRLVLDHLDASAAAAHRPGRDWEASATGGFWSADPYLVLTETFVDAEALARRIRYTLLTGAMVRRFDVWEHCYSEEAMRALLAAAGFDRVQTHRGVLDGVDPQSADVVFTVATA